MSRVFKFDGLGSFHALEQKLSLSAVAVCASTTHGGDLPPPDPEPDPGPLPGDDPIVYPPTPESGPVGPG